MINNISYEQIKDIKLGAIYSKDETTFKVFAPSVKQIYLAISKDYRNPRKDFIKMEKGEYDIYQVTLSGDYEGYFYSYFVDDKYMVTDPYSFASSINSMYSVVCDMDKTNPQGFLETPVPQIPENEAIIYELNVKNYTADETSGIKDRGKYLGLCQEGATYKGLSTGIDNLVDLGVTHVQLLPIYDFISVDESNDRFFDDDNYNWGYDPELYFNPEGSYATDPTDPTNRIFEIKEMIGKFHQKNIAVVMDVVFNHTFKSYDSNLNTLGRNYYHRMTKDGNFSNGTGVGNELASDRPFVRKLIIDSLKYWVKEYKIDGFRFDLMAIIDLDTIKLAVKELRKINPNIIIYGEPWMALETTLPANLHTIKGSQRSNGFGVFNDIFRDAIKGDTDSYGTGYIQGDYYLKPIIEQSIAGSIAYDEVRAGFADDASESINYFNCHDNLILYDKLQISLKNLDQIDDYVKFAMGLIFLSFGKVFIYEGNEFNHTKKNDRNSYNSPLFVNAINWKEKEEHLDIFNYTKDLVELRKSLKAFTKTDASFIRKNLKFMDGIKDSMIIYSLAYRNSKNLVVINAGQEGEIVPRRSIESFINDKNLSIENIFSKEGKNTSKKIEGDLYVEGLSINVYNLGGKMDYKESFDLWYNNDKFDDQTKKELEEIKDNDEEIKDRFYSSLEFGTAGLRGKLGAGTNRMNEYMVAQASQGFADTVAEMGEDAKKAGVAISYDVRHKSEEFARVTAEVFAANGIKVYIHKEIQPTPVLSYTVRHLKTAAGVMITASHNPMEYNGYKAYNSEGSQILDETADKILGHIAEHPDFFEIPRIDFEKGLEDGIIEWVSDDLIEDYVKEVLACTINEDIDKDIKIVYTPLNGAGNKLVRRILDERGFKNIYVVPEQENPDPNFTTVGYPNPEDPAAFKYSEKLGKEKDADLLLATDPDSDRCAVEIKDANGEYVFLTGNKIGSLLTNYILSALKENGELPENPAVVKSLVSTDLISPICEKYGVKKYDVLTGFKNIYAVANELDRTGEGKFVFGFEESIGYNYKDFVRDKDAVNSAMMISEMAGYYKKQGKSLLDVLEDIYQEHGFYANEVVSITLTGLDGQARIGRIMEEVRNNPIDELAGLKTEKIIDYKFDETGLPKSNVLKYYFEDKSWLALRPSGTEPKIKMYVNAISDSRDGSEAKKDELIKAMREIIDSVE